MKAILNQNLQKKKINKNKKIYRKENIVPKKKKEKEGHYRLYK